MSASSRRPDLVSAFGLAGQARRNLGAFAAAYAWLLRDLIAFSRPRVAAVIALNLFGVALQWAVLGGVLLFVAKLTGEGGAFQAPLLGGLDLPVDASLSLITGWGAVILVLVVGAAFSTYGAEAIGFETARRYVGRSGQAILRTTLTARTGADHGEPPARQLQRVLARDQTMILRALLVVQRSLRSFLMVGIAVIVLALINPVLTTVVVVVAAFFALPYYLINRRVVEAAASLEYRSAGARVSILRLVDHATAREPNPEIVRTVSDSYSADTAIADRWSALREILLGRQRTTAVMSALLGSCLVAIVVAFGLIIARGGASWVAALTFLLALNLASGAFIQLAGEVTAANRFLPHLQNLISFTERLEAGSTAVGDNLAPSERTGALSAVIAPHPALADSERELPLTAGTRALCVSPQALDRLNLHALVSRLVAGSVTQAQRLREAAFFYGDSSSLPGVSARALLGDHGARALDELGLGDEIDRLPDGDSTVLTPEVQDRLSGFLRYVLGVVEGVEHELIVLGWASFSRLSSHERGRLLEILQRRPVLFVTTRAPRRQPAEATHTIVLTERGIAGMGDARWYQSIAGEVARVDARQAPAVGMSAGLDDLDADG